MTPSQAMTDGQTHTDAVTRTAQEILAALEARDSAKVASYYAPDAVLATPGRPAVRGAEAVSKAIRPGLPPSLAHSLLYEPADQTGGERRGHRLDRLQEAGGRQLEGCGGFRG